MRRSRGYVVRDPNGQALAYIYGRANEIDARQAKVLTGDEARRIAMNMARCRSCSGRVATRTNRRNIPRRLPLPNRRRDHFSP
jgi:uncharacterized protein with PIN domain